MTALEHIEEKVRDLVMFGASKVVGEYQSDTSAKEAFDLGNGKEVDAKLILNRTDWRKLQPIQERISTEAITATQNTSEELYSFEGTNYKALAREKEHDARAYDNLTIEMVDAPEGISSRRRGGSPERSPAVTAEQLREREQERERKRRKREEALVEKWKSLNYVSFHVNQEWRDSCVESGSIKAAPLCNVCGDVTTPYSFAGGAASVSEERYLVARLN